LNARIIGVTLATALFGPACVPMRCWPMRQSLEVTALRPVIRRGSWSSSLRQSGVFSCAPIS